MHKFQQLQMEMEWLATELGVMTPTPDKMMCNVLRGRVMNTVVVNVLMVVSVVVNALMDVQFSVPHVNKPVVNMSKIVKSQVANIFHEIIANKILKNVVDQQSR